MKYGRTDGSSAGTSSSALKRSAIFGMSAVNARVTRRPVRRAERGLHVGEQLRTAAQPGERGAEPLAVRRVLAFDEEAEAHHVADEARGDDCGTGVVTDLRTAAGERLLLRDALPLTAEDVQPDRVRVPRQVVACRGDGAGSVFEHRTGGERAEMLRRDAQPVARVHRPAWIASEPAVELFGHAREEHLMTDRRVVTARVARRIPTKRVGDRVFDGVDQLAARGPVETVGEHEHLRTPAVVGRLLGVEPEHV